LKDWDKESFGLRLKNLREQRKLSMMAFGAAIGTSASRIKDWERGKNAPSAAWIASISDRFNISTDELILGEANGPTTFKKNDLTKTEMLYDKLRESILQDPSDNETNTDDNEIYASVDALNKEKYRSGKGRRLAEQELFELVVNLSKKDVIELLELAKIKKRLV
jgi:transcriptional regulator with XRE-family HTH domain